MRIDSFLTAGTIFTSRPGYVWIGYGTARSGAIAQPEELSFYFPDFFLTSSSPWVSYTTTLEMSIKELISQLTGNLIASESLDWVMPDAVLFKKTFEELQLHFAKGALQKAVPYVMASTTEAMSRARLLGMLHHALNYVSGQPGCLYGTWDENGGILGVTPEPLFEVRERYLKTTACAGTRSTADAPEKLLQDPKELHEHRLVVEGIIDSLKGYGRPQVGSCQVMKLPLISHLVTPIELKLMHAVEFDDLVRALHPTPALGAFPKEAGMDWLRQYQQKVNRKRYGAPVGVYNSQMARCMVAIRNIQWDENGMEIAAGCGVVAASQFKQEWKEIQMKIKAIREILGL